MSDSDTEGFYENEWDECGDLVWNEFDWERYLREQDDTLHRYLAHYERLKGHPERIDEVAACMGWDVGQRLGETELAASDLEAGPDDLPAPSGDYPIEPYTLHKNPVFIATKAIYLSLKRSWERVAGDAAKIDQPQAFAVYASLFRGEEHALLGVQALDLGDYAMAVSLFKRALQELNRTLALAGGPTAASSRVWAAWRDDAHRRLFDLREIWLRVIHECRQELERRVDDES
ncbi:MAG TPA: hypothetical protein VLT83_00640 [Opitutaceae bacterium]|nr:hypothetical protein [Opitutaceae bacterium]